MNTIRNMVIGTLMATLMLTMLAAPAAAIVTANIYVDPDYTSADYIMNYDGVTKLRYYGGSPETGDLLQLILPGPNGVQDPPDPTDPNYIGGDDVLDPNNPTCYVGKIYNVDGKFWCVAESSSTTTETWYVRAWNAETIGTATHYGDSILFTGQQGTANYDLLPSGTWWTDQPKPASTELVQMEVGRNDISLCYELSSNVPEDVLSSIWTNVSVVKEWDAVSKTWAEATTMDRDGTGYSVYVTTACTWEHTGMSMTAPMTIPLVDGLNFVGYPFGKTNSTGDALVDASGEKLNYYYAAPFDASTQKYVDSYNPAAPAPFNDFKTISPCEAFWVSSKDGVDWRAA